MPLSGLASSRLLWSSTLGGPISGAAGEFLLDNYPDAFCAYSFRKLRTAYAGSAISLRREDNGNLADIGFDGNGDFDVAAAASHISGTTGKIKTWYDQSGNSLDLTQGNNSLLPHYSSNGLGGLPTAEFPSGSLWVQRSSVNPSTSGHSGTNFMGFSVCHVDSGDSDGDAAALCWVTTTDSHIFGLYPSISSGADVGADFGNIGGSYQTFGGAPTTDTDIVFEAYRDTGDTQEVLISGSSQVSATRTGDLTSADGVLSVGRGIGNGFQFGDFTGYISEVILWDADGGSSARTAIRSDLTTYYNI